jgi:chorismate synthase
MARNSIGKQFVITSFGESHGPAVGSVVDGFPSNTMVDIDFIRYQMNRRRPGQSSMTTDRKESDDFEILSGLFEGKSTGAPMAFLIKNTNAQSKDYSNLKDIYRPGHADYTYQAKYGIRDHNGGGRSSARITSGWVAAGALAQAYLKQKYNIDICAYTQSVGSIIAPPLENISREMIDSHVTRCPHESTAMEMETLINRLKTEGNSVGGKISCSIKGLKAGIGEPVFGKLNALLSYYMMSINAVKSVEIGHEDLSTQYGSDLADEPNISGTFNTKHNHNSGILGGISSGEDIHFTVGFKPPSSISKAQKAFNTNFDIVDLNINGRHDPCVLPRAVPIVETMTAALLLDLILENQ